MKNTIIKLFNLEPMDIDDVQIQTVNDEIYAFVTLRVFINQCPNCATATRSVHDYRRRVITHGVINDAITTIIFNQRRYRCRTCGKVFSEANPFVLRNRRISTYAIRRIMKMLKNPRVTFAQVAGEVGVSTPTVTRVFDQYAGITPIRLPDCLCIDEIYTVKYKRRVYACVLVDMLTSQIYDLRPSRYKYELAEYFSKIDRNERLRVKYVCMDMWETYRELARIYFPEAKVCVDSFHVIQLINRSFTNIRVKVMKQYPSSSEEYRLLKKYSWLLTKDSSKMNLDKYINLHYYYSIIGSKYISTRNLIDRLLMIDTELEIAYTLKEEYAYINRTSTSENIESRLERFIDELPVYGIPELNRISKTLRNWHDEIINSFDRYGGRRISNGPVESVNSRLKLLKRSANGYRDFERFRTRALYCLNNNSSIKL